MLLIHLMSLLPLVLYLSLFASDSLTHSLTAPTSALVLSFPIV